MPPLLLYLPLALHHIEVSPNRGTLHRPQQITIFIMGTPLPKGTANFLKPHLDYVDSGDPFLRIRSALLKVWGSG